VSGARTLWEEGHAPGHETVALGVALALTVAALDSGLGGRIGLVFDLAFVGVCVLVALLVRPEDFFTVGVLPPLLMLGTMVLVAVNGTKVIAQAHDNVVQAVVTGLAHHAIALFIGYAVCLVTLVLRQRAGR